MEEVVFYYNHIQQSKISRTGLIFNQSLGSADLNTDFPEEPWMESLQTRIEIQRKSLYGYRAWAKEHRLPFLEVPLVVASEDAKGVICATSDFIVEQGRFLKHFA